jgi:hypothetical protein
MRVRGGMIIGAKTARRSLLARNPNQLGREVSDYPVGVSAARAASIRVFYFLAQSCPRDQPVGLGRRLCRDG